VLLLIDSRESKRASVVVWQPRSAVALRGLGEVDRVFSGERDMGP
jgi:hypothetical protein